MVIGTWLGWSTVATVILSVNKWLIDRGKGHAVVHKYHHKDAEHTH